MRIGVMADSHDNLPMISRAISLFERRGLEVLIHSGDIIAPFAMKEIVEFPGRLIAIFGNNDGERKGLRKVFRRIREGPLKVNIKGKIIVVTHELGALSRKMQGEADIIVYGHTHIPEVKCSKPLVINPGECGGWLSGKPTVAIIDLEEMSAEIIDLSLGRRKRR